jgi:2-keto-4-pentenoate hydratase/2-oxohepta-3-ene-1,7-dioic acid hydratase in catechol pathway
MRLVTFHFGGKPTLGVVSENGVVPVPGMTLLEVIATGSGLPDKNALAQKTAVSFKSSDLLAPIPTPRRNVMAIGLNYVDHIKESSETRGKPTKIPTYPVFFTKATNAVIGPNASIPFNPAVTTELDWEVELGVIIGKRGINIPVERAYEHVFGYTIINDVSARDLQMRHGQFFKGKSLDGTCPMGPWIVTQDEIPDPQNLDLRSRVNGIVKQNANTSQMIFKIPEIIAHLSLGMTLEPGDIIATGTPSGVGFSRTPPEFLKPGDTVECEIDGIGTLSNPVV